MRKLFITSVILLYAITITAQSLNGSWTGELKVGPTTLPLVLNISTDENGANICTMDSPAQGAKDIPTKIDFISNDSLAVSVTMIGASFQGNLKGDELSGTFSQNGFQIPLVLKKGKTEVRRPQHPLPPYPYTTEEVTFTNEKDHATLAGTLTYPVGYEKMKKKKVPVVLMVSGSGQQNRDEEIFEHKPFLVIADYLARHGIASLRYDDRATGASVGGEVKNATTLDFSHDAEAGVLFLRNTKKFGKIGVLGHSEGASIAFMLGAMRLPDFIISMAGIGVKGDEALTAQVNRITQLSGISSVMTVEQYRQQPAVADNPWMRWFIDYDPRPDIVNTRCPVFAINGDKDCQVLVDPNLKGIGKALFKGRENLTKEYPSLNHLFQHCTTGLPNEYISIEETISPEVLEDIVEWINIVKEKRVRR